MPVKVNRSPLRREEMVERYRAVKSLADAGHSQRQIGARLGLDQRRVSWILSHPVAEVVVPPLPVRQGVRFAAIGGFAGYAVGDDGSVWSSHTKSFHRPPGWYPVKVRQPDSHSAYCRVSLRENAGKGRNCVRYVHRLVLEEFVGPCPKGQECRHADRNTANNRLDNLCWGTRGENAEDRRRHGTMPVGSTHKKAKLTEELVRESNRLRKLGWSQRKRAEKFGVSPSIIGRIDRGEGWRHVE